MLVRSLVDRKSFNDDTKMDSQRRRCKNEEQEQGDDEDGEKVMAKTVNIYSSLLWKFSGPPAQYEVVFCFH